MHRGPKKEPFIAEFIFPNGDIKRARNGTQAVLLFYEAYRDHIMGRDLKMKSYGGVKFTYTEVDYSAEAQAAQQKLIKRLKGLVYAITPLRSGKLMDHIVRTLKLNMISAGDQFQISVSYTLPEDRPRVIINARHKYPDKGYGEWGTVKLTDPVVKSKVKIHHVTAGGNALYYLDDYKAIETYSKYLEEGFQRIVQFDFENFKRKTEVKMLA